MQISVALFTTNPIKIVRNIYPVPSIVFILHLKHQTRNLESNIEEVVIDIESNCSESKSSLLHDQVISPDEKKYETAEYQLKNYRTAQALILVSVP